MNLVHFSATRITVVEPRTQGVDRPSGVYKPAGFWVSDESAEQSWTRWCADEEWGDPLAQVPHAVTLAAGHRVLHLSDADGLREFTAIYGGSGRWSEDIRWAEVAREYAGLLITPYVWECRLGMSWYYGWDCASGCIWDPAAIASVTPLTSEVTA